MSSSTSRSDSLGLQDAKHTVQLRSWPIIDEGLSAWLLAAAVIVVALFAGFWTDNPWLGMLSLVVLMTATWKLWLPVSYQLGPTGIDQRIAGRCFRVSWSAVARYEVLKRGILLLPHRKKVPLAVLHGLFIPWCGRRDEIIQTVEYYVVPSIGPLDSTVSRPAGL